MPLPPPTESLHYYNTLHVRIRRLPGSLSGPYDVTNMYTQKWRRKLRNWVRVPKELRHLTNPYTSYVWSTRPEGRAILSYTRSPGYGKVYDYYEVSGDLFVSGNMETWLATRVTVADDDPLLTEVRNACLKKAAGATFNAALFTAEAGKTLDLLTVNAAKIARSFREIKHGRVMRQPLKTTIRKAMSALGLINSKKWDPKASRASQWLEYRYGVETLMMDVRDSAEYAASKASDQPEEMSWTAVRRTSSSVVVDYPTDISCFGTGIDSWVVPGVKRSFATVSTAKAWIRAEMETKGYRSMQQLGFANPVGLAWELIPFSFVADWALNIGSYLDLQSSLWGLKVLDSGFSLQRDGFADLLAIPHVENNGNYFSRDLSGDLEKAFSTNRYQRWVWSNPSPEYTLGSGLNAKRVVDSIALTFLQFRK